MKTRYLSFLAICIGLVFSACTSEPEKPMRVSDEVKKAYYYIDQGQSDEAIAVVNQALRYFPNHEDLLSAKASAYISKIGINIKSFYHFAETLDAISDADHQPQQVFRRELFEILLQNSNPDVVNFAHEVLQVLEFIDNTANFLAAFNSIPNFEFSQIYNILDARNILLGIRQPKKSTVYFRTLVEIILLKFKIKNNYYFYDIDQCSNIDLIGNRLREIEFDIDVLLSDYKSLYPNSKVNFNFSNIYAGFAEIESLDTESDDLEILKLILEIFGAELQMELGDCYE